MPPSRAGMGEGGADLRVPAPGQAKKVALLGSLDHAIRELVVHTSPTKRSSDFVAHLEQLDRLYGPEPGSPSHRWCWSRTTARSTPANSRWRRWPPASIGSPSNRLPEYAPELNDIETVWRDLKAHHLAHQTFDDIDALERRHPPGRRRPKPLPVRSAPSQPRGSAPCGR